MQLAFEQCSDMPCCKILHFSAAQRSLLNARTRSILFTSHSPHSVALHVNFFTSLLLGYPATYQVAHSHSGILAKNVTCTVAHTNGSSCQFPRGLHRLNRLRLFRHKPCGVKELKRGFTQQRMLLGCVYNASSRRGRECFVQVANCASINCRQLPDHLHTTAWPRYLFRL